MSQYFNDSPIERREDDRYGVHAFADHESCAEIGVDEVKPEHFAEADVAIAIGGDGTLIRTAYLVSECGTPIIGIHYGRFGFVTQVEPEEADETIRRRPVGSRDQIVGAFGGRTRGRRRGLSRPAQAGDRRQRPAHADEQGGGAAAEQLGRLQSQRLAFRRPRRDHRPLPSGRSRAAMPLFQDAAVHAQ